MTCIVGSCDEKVDADETAIVSMEDYQDIGGAVAVGWFPLFFPVRRLGSGLGWELQRKVLTVMDIYLNFNG